MGEHTDFATVLRTFMARARRKNMDLAHLTGISIHTIEHWTSGAVRRPRFMPDVLKLAYALTLNAQDTTILLTAAEHPPLDTLQAQAQQTGDGKLLGLLAPWDSGAPPSAPVPQTPFVQPSITPRYQLRPPVVDFVGREHEIAHLVLALRTAHAQGGVALGGVQGMGGIGKTELAYVVAQQLRDAFPDAQIVVSLRGYSAAPLPLDQALRRVISAFTSETQLPTDLPALQALYYSVLHGRRALILADDASDAAQVLPLIPPAGCALLVTSRLRFTLPGMITLNLEQIGEEQAVQLLSTLCTRLNPANAQELAQLCGYLPLALRIGGSILCNDRALNVAAYLARLADARQRLAQLRDPDDPQLDVAASLALSYTQLDGIAQQFFRQLGMFVADFTTELAQAVIEPPAGIAVDATLRLLLRRNLVLYDAVRDRWRLHELVRDLARHYLEAAGEHVAVMWRYAQAAVQIAQATQEQYRAGGEDSLAALVRFDVERPHMDEARRWAASHAGRAEGDALLVADALATRDIGLLRYNARRERLPQLIGAIAAAQRLSDQSQVGQLLTRLGHAYIDLGAPHQVRYSGQQALRIARTIGDRQSECKALANLAIAYAQQGAFRQAIPYLERTLAIAQEQDDQIAIAGHLADLGRAYGEIGMFRHALHYLERARVVHHLQRNQLNELVIFEALGRVYVARRDALRAIAALEHGLKRVRVIRYRFGEGCFLSVLGQAYTMRGDHVSAAMAFASALTILQEVGARWGEAECQWHFGLLLVQRGEQTRALPQLRTAVAYEQEIGHAKAAQHAALVARLEVGETVPVELLNLLH